MSKPEDLTGRVFGRLTVVELFVEDISDGCVVKRRGTRWKCVCECGNTTVSFASNLKRGSSTSCGCFAKEKMSITKKTHGGWANKEKLFNVWLGMRKRCLSTTSSNYDNYGGRGIKICDEWVDDYAAFRTWSLNNGYKEGLSIDRIDVDGNYSPDNCRWTDIKTQQNNRRCNINITFNNETHTLKEWSRIVGISYPTLYTRHKLGWCAKDLLTGKTD